MLINTILQIVYLSVSLIVFSRPTAFLAIAMGVVGFLLLESINYIENYGLMRNQRKSGKYLQSKKFTPGITIPY
jgi:alkane 1-monooxygenase